MKKNFVFVALAAVIAMCATSCKKDESVLKFTATIERGDSKTALAEWANDARQVVWAEGDQIKVFGGELGTYANLGYICNLTSGIGATTAEFTVATPDDRLNESTSFTAVYPVDAWTSTEQVYINADQTFIPGNVDKYPMMAVSNNTHLQFKNVCGIIEVKLPQVSGVSLTGMKILAGHQISGDYQVSWVDGEPSLTPMGGANGFDEIEVSFPGVIDLSPETRPSVLVFLPAGDHPGIKIEFYTTDFTYTKITAHAQQNINVTRSKITTLDFSSVDGNSIEWRPMPIQRHYFSVSPTLQVDIAHGNLIHGNSENGGNWFIAQNAWDVYGNFDYFTDLFHWSNGTNNGYGLSQVNFQADNFSFQDWGTLVHSNTETDWRSLTAAEWKYLTNSEGYENTVRANKAYYVYITDMHYTDMHRHEYNLGGILLMPDDWNHEDDPTNYEEMDDNFRECEINRQTLIAFIEKGCAFIPNTGSAVDEHPIDLINEGYNTVWLGYYLLAYPDALIFHAADYEHEEVSFLNYNSVSEFGIDEFWYQLGSRYAVRLVRNAMHRDNNTDPWSYYQGFAPTSKGKRRK